jgi:two-component system chemotaxis response regulator CheB
MTKIRVLLVDDAVVVRRILTDVLGSDPELEVVGTAANGRLALSRLGSLNPDVVIMDVEMPEMDGLEALAALRKTHPRLPVIMFSTLTRRGALATLDALALGATDYVTKPANVGSVAAAMQRVRDDLIPKIKQFHQRRNPAPAPAPAAPVPEARRGRSSLWSMQRIDVVALGVSTGGPNALAALLPGLPADFPVPVLIVQHMPPLFTKLLAERLDAASALRVREAVTGSVLQPGEAWVAPGDHHMVVSREAGKVVLRLNQGPPENSCRPAVDPLFRSVAQAYGPAALCVVLTGMGSDGLRGCEAVCEAGGRVLAQDEASSVVWGMPGMVARAGLAEQVLPLGSIAPAVVGRVLLGRPAPGRQPAG